VRSGHRIGITFDGAEVGQLRISEGLEALLAPAVLPRGSLQHKLLLALKEVRTGRWVRACVVLLLAEVWCAGDRPDGAGGVRADAACM
jgi:hypothetical protein